MKSVGSIILTVGTVLALVGRMFPSYVHALDTFERSTERPVYDGPCSSESNVLCQMSENPGAAVIPEAHVMVIRPAAVMRPSAWKSPSRLFSAKRNGSRRDPNGWREYLTSFRPVVPSAMPTGVHSLKDPHAANQKAKELLEKAPPVFKIIAACESGMKHYNQATGNVLQGAITPGDIGLLQINSLVHGKDALRNGFNIYSIYGNIGFGIKLYIEKGTQPWNSSKKCWGPKVPSQLQLPLPEQM